jgi:hypothetical protein
MSLSDDLIDEIRGEFPRFRIVHKSESRLSRAIDIVLKIVTLWGQRDFMSRYHTVIADTLYVPGRWDDASDTDRAITLVHERVHLRQRRRYGDVVMTLLYLVPFFPLGLAYGRARIEWEAYAETLRATAELRGMQVAQDPALRERIVRQFTGAAYGWMWPFPRTINRWYDEALEAIRQKPAPSASTSPALPAR